MWQPPHSNTINSCCTSVLCNDNLNFIATNVQIRMVALCHAYCLCAVQVTNCATVFHGVSDLRVVCASGQECIDIIPLFIGCKLHVRMG